MGPTFGVTIVTRTTTTQLIAERLSNLNSRKRLALKPKLDPERSLLPSFSFSKKLMHSKGNLSLKRMQAVRRATRKAESILSTEINLTTSSDEGEEQEYLFTSSKPFRYSKIISPNH
jgi:hypothetical protein